MRSSAYLVSGPSCLFETIQERGLRRLDLHTGLVQAEPDDAVDLRELP